MLMTCPHCQFARDIPPEKIPDRPVQVTCPRCKASFPFTRGEFTFDPPPAAPRPQPAAALPGLATNAAAEDLPKAGFWIRVGAAMIDALAAGALQMAFGALLGVVIGLSSGGDPEAQAGLTALAAIFSLVVYYGYFVFFTGYCGQTPGKMAVRIKVIRTDGSEMDYGRALLRETIGKFISGIILGIGYLMVAFDSQKQGLHDKIANTYVIKL